MTDDDSTYDDHHLDELINEVSLIKSQIHTIKREMIVVFVLILLANLLFVVAVFDDEAQANVSCPTPLAHRGVHTNTIDENSITSITRMSGRGAAEVDVHLTKDDVPILMHDKGVNRTTTGEGLVRDLTLAQIKAMELEITGERVPTLRQAVRAAERSRVQLVVELKQYQQWSPETLTLVGNIANNATVRVYIGGMYGFATAVPNYANWIYWRPNGVLPTPSNAAEYGADLILDTVNNWTRSMVRVAKEAGYKTGTRLTTDFEASNRLGVDYVLTNRPSGLIKYCRSL